ncbi:glycosyltransferase family 2 protein [Niabella terrae]
MALTSIITVNYNQPKVTVEFLESVRKHIPAAAAEIILVDNAPTEDHRANFEAAYPELIYLHSPENLGFAGGNNLGIRQARGAYILLLNNDTELSPNFLEILLQEMDQHPEIGLLSPLIKYFEQPSVIQYAGFTHMNYYTCRNRGIGAMETDQGQFRQDSRETGFCHGAAVMCRRSDLEIAGLMDESYFLYYEELDWSEKFRRAGKKSWFTGRTEIFHKESMSVGRQSPIKAYYMTRNRWLFIRKNTGWLTSFIFSIYYLGMAMPKQLFSYLKSGRRDLVTASLRGLCWHLTHSPHPKPN